MNDRDVMRKAVKERLLNRAAIRDRAIERAEERLQQPGLRVHGNAPRKLVLAANILLLTLVIGLIAATTGRYWLPADETTASTTAVVTTTTTSETTTPTTTTPTTTAKPLTKGTLAGEPGTLTIAKGGIGAFQQKLWELAGDPAAPFPEYYAGAYFEHPGTFQGFTVLVTCDPSLVKQDLWKAADRAGESLPYAMLAMEVVQVEHSYNELLIQYNAILKLMANLPEDLSEADQSLIRQISRIGIDEKENEVYIEVPIGTTGVVEALARALADTNGYSEVDAAIRVYEMPEIMSTGEVYSIIGEFLASHDLKIIPNTAFGPGNYRLPDSFEAITEGYPIGEFFRQRNERSILIGLDFSSYMGTDVIISGGGVLSVSDEIRLNDFL